MNRLYAFITSLGYRSRLFELRRLVFVYFAEDSEESYYYTFRSVVIIGHCFKLIAQNCCDLLNLDVYIDEHWLKYYFPTNWGLEEDAPSSEHAGLELVEGMADLGLVRGIHKPRFPEITIRNPKLWYPAPLTSDEDDLLDATGESRFTKRGKKYLRQLESDMKRPNLRDMGAQVSKDPNEYSMTSHDVKCQYELEKEDIKEDLMVQKEEEWCVDNIPSDERVRFLLNERRRSWRQSVFGSQPLKPRSYDISELWVIGTLCISSTMKNIMI